MDLNKEKDVEIAKLEAKIDDLQGHFCKDCSNVLITNDEYNNRGTCKCCGYQNRTCKDCAMCDECEKCFCEKRSSYCEMCTPKKKKKLKTR